MDHSRIFSGDTQMTSIIAQFNAEMDRLNAKRPRPDVFVQMDRKDREELVIGTHHQALRATALAIKRLLDPEEMPDNSLEMRCHRLMIADQLWMQRVVPFRFAIKTMVEDDSPDLTKQ